MENTINMKKIVGSRLRQAREARNLTRDQLCDRINAALRSDPSYNPSAPDRLYLVANTYRFWEAGVNQINIAYIPVLAQVLDFDVGYLFGEHHEFHKEAADICAVTGLSEDAVASLKAHNRPTGFPSVSKGINPQKILSSFISDGEFWRILNSLFTYSDPTMLAIIDGMLSLSAMDGDVYGESVPIIDTGRETMIAGITRHFGNVAERAIGWDKEEKKENT